MNKELTETEFETDPYTLFIFAFNSPSTKEKSVPRLNKFFEFIGITGTLQEKCAVFAKKAIDQQPWAVACVIKYLQMNKTEFVRIVDKVSIENNDFSDKIHQYKKSYKRKYETIKLRRKLVEILFSTRNYNKHEIAEFLGVHQQTVTRDIQWLKSAEKKEIMKKLEKKSHGDPHGFSVVVDEVLRLSWDFDFIKKLIRPERLHLNL